MPRRASYVDTIWKPLDAVRFATPPRTLYHYASPAAVLGILSSDTLWATHHRFFNDVKEGKDGVRILRRAIQRAVDTGVLGEDLAPFDNWDASDGPVGAVGTAGLFVASLTEQPDDLNQWRCYCPDGGYALGFDAQRLAHTLASSRLGELVKVVYAETEKQKLASELVLAANAAWRFALSRRARATVLSRIRAEITEAVITCFCVFKHRSFAAEEEWRIIASGDLSDPGRLHFRATRSLIVPYAQMRVLGRRQQVLTHVTVGPSPHRATAAEGIWHCLHETGNGRARIRISTVPHRAL